MTTLSLKDVLQKANEQYEAFKNKRSASPETEMLTLDVFDSLKTYLSQMYPTKFSSYSMGLSVHDQGLLDLSVSLNEGGTDGEGMERFHIKLQSDASAIVSQSIIAAKNTIPVGTPKVVDFSSKKPEEAVVAIFAKLAQVSPDFAGRLVKETRQAATPQPTI